jgi:hypothetical protein
MRRLGTGRLPVGHGPGQGITKQGAVRHAPVNVDLSASHDSISWETGLLVEASQILVVRCNISWRGIAEVSKRGVDEEGSILGTTTHLAAITRARSVTCAWGNRRKGVGDTVTTSTGAGMETSSPKAVASAEIRTSLRCDGVVDNGAGVESWETVRRRVGRVVASRIETCVARLISLEASDVHKVQSRTA